MQQHAVSGRVRVAARGLMVVAAVVLSGCTSGTSAPTATASSASSASSAVASATSSGSSTTTTPSTTPFSTTFASAGTTTEPPAGRKVEISVKGTRVTPPPSRIDLAVGQSLTLVVTCDCDDEVHVHGFETVADVVPGRPTTITVTAKTPGVYEVEVHEPALTLLSVAVR